MIHGASSKTQEFLRRAAFAAVLGAFAFSVAGCGGGPACGNGKADPGEECDDGNNDDTDVCLSTCLLRPTRDLTVTWDFNADEASGFTGDSCIDTGARNVTVDLSGPKSAEAMEQCSFRQVVFRDLAPGSYTASATPFDAGEQAIATATEASIELGDFGDYELEINIPPENWSNAYTGNYFFRVDWGGPGVDCADATPPVVTQALIFTRGGTQVAAMTKAGDPLDGTQTPCQPLDAAEPQTVLDVPFGPATLQIMGYDAGGILQYEQTFETFIGAGVNNPEFRFEVMATPPPSP